LTAIVLGAVCVELSAPARAQDQPPAAKPQQEAAAPAQAKGAAKLPGPPEIPEVQLGPVLKTTPMQRRAPGPNQTQIDASVLPKDKQGIWVLDFTFKPVRIVEVDDGRKKHRYYYLYYRVVNRTGKPRTFVPQFTLVTDTGKRYEDTAGLPQALAKIQKKEDPNVEVHGAVDINGIIPPSKKEGVDDVVTGAAIWENIDPHADAFKIYVRGLSDGYQLVTPPGADKDKRVIRDKTLRLDFTRPGDERNVFEGEIHPADPPYEWIYWGDRPAGKAYN
jgi:hypothetical protein